MYFCRLFSIISNDIQIFGISHLGIYLIKNTENSLQILETYTFDMIQRISFIENSLKIDIHLTKKIITISSFRVEKFSLFYMKAFLRGKNVLD